MTDIARQCAEEVCDQWADGGMGGFEGIYTDFALDVARLTLRKHGLPCGIKLADNHGHCREDEKCFECDPVNGYGQSE